MVGVPVLPTRLMPIPLPPSELENIQTNGSMSPSVTPEVTKAPQPPERKWKIKHIDFTPQINTATKKTEQFG